MARMPVLYPFPSYLIIDRGEPKTNKHEIQISNGQIIKLEKMVNPDNTHHSRSHKNALPEAKTNCQD